MSESDENQSISERGFEAVGGVAQSLLDNPLFSGALSRAVAAGEGAMAAPRAALSALDVATSDEVSRLERRLREVDERVAALEDALDDAQADVATLRKKLRDAEAGED